MSTFAKDGGFLFATFKGEKSPLTEQVYFALSSDGKKWEALNGGEPVLVSQVGEKGVRDPFLVRSPDGGKIYLIATDLSISLNPSWDRSMNAGSQSIVIWESTDLVQWTEPRLVRVAAEDAGCTWAPEAIYDEQSKDYLVFWASTSKSDNFSKHRIWAARTKDFQAFSKPFIYIERPNPVIDATITRADGKYFRFTKDEKFKAITLEESESLEGNWRDVPGFSVAKMTGYEGPECFLLEPAGAGRPATWCLVLDQYKGTGYHPFLTHDLAAGQFVPGDGFEFPFRFRHGMVLPISETEFQRLKTTPVRTAPL